MKTLFLRFVYFCKCVSLCSRSVCALLFFAMLIGFSDDVLHKILIVSFLLFMAISSYVVEFFFFHARKKRIEWNISMNEFISFTHHCNVGLEEWKNWNIFQYEQWKKSYKRQENREREEALNYQKKLFFQNNGIHAVITVWLDPKFLMMFIFVTYRVFAPAFLILTPIWNWKLHAFSVSDFFSTLAFIALATLISVYFFLFFFNLIFALVLRFRFRISYNQAMDSYFFYQIHKQKHWMFWSKKKFESWFEEVRYVNPFNPQGY